MSNPSPVLRPHFDLLGDLSTETWPAFLDPRTFNLIAQTVIGHRDFRVQEPGQSAIGDPVHRFLVGESWWSRKMATDERDPLGIVYLLEDDGSSWFNGRELKPVVAARAVTLGHLVKLGYTGIRNFLGADMYKNSRLAPPSLTQEGALSQPEA